MIRTQSRVRVRVWVRVRVRVRAIYLNQTDNRHQIHGGVGVRVNASFLFPVFLPQHIRDA